MNNGVNNMNQQPTNQIPSQPVLPTVQPQQVLNQPQQPTNQIPSQPVIVQSQQVLTNQTEIQQDVENKNKPKKKLNLSIIFIFIILILIGYIIFMNNNYKQTINNVLYDCTPVPTDKETTLDVNSTLVKDLYSKVQTTVKEDLANPNFDDNLKLYLAYRQIKEKDKYDSNCNLFDKNKMEPYTCEVSTNFTPKAFKEETIKQEIKKLFGEKTNIPLKNIQLNNSCIVGYQYIKERGEFVEGYCTGQNAMLYKVEKEITKAVSTGNTIYLTEEVKYRTSEGKDLPNYLKNGTYTYIFRLDMNYNYVIISKKYEEKY